MQTGRVRRRTATRHFGAVGDSHDGRHPSDGEGARATQSVRSKADRTSTNIAGEARPPIADQNSQGQNVVETKKRKTNVLLALLNVVGEVGLERKSGSHRPGEAAEKVSCF